MFVSYQNHKISVLDIRQKKLMLLINNGVNEPICVLCSCPKKSGFLSTNIASHHESELWDMVWGWGCQTLGGKMR